MRDMWEIHSQELQPNIVATQNMVISAHNKKASVPVYTILCSQNFLTSNH